MIVPMLVPSRKCGEGRFPRGVVKTEDDIEAAHRAIRATIIKSRDKCPHDGTTKSTAGPDSVPGVYCTLCGRRLDVDHREWEKLEDARQLASAKRYFL